MPRSWAPASRRFRPDGGALARQLRLDELPGRVARHLFDELDLAGKDVLAAGDDHVVLASVDEEAARLVEVAEVARVHQVVDGLPRAAAGVALEDELAADEDVARLVGTDLPVVVVEDPQGGA